MKKVVIIGAGPAGVTAGYELLKNRDGSDETYEVLILEQSDAIGGISRTVRHNGNRMDIGGHRFFSKDNDVTDWWSEIMPRQGAPAMDDKILGRSVPTTPGGPDPGLHCLGDLIQVHVPRNDLIIRADNTYQRLVHLFFCQTQCIKQGSVGSLLHPLLYCITFHSLFLPYTAAAIRSPISEVDTFLHPSEKISPVL